MRIKTELFPYQEKAVKKLLPLKVGALFMEMGTGKTRTTLEIIQRRLDKGKLEHVLWLCPCSVRENLKEDIRKHTDGGLSCIAVYGIESLSSSIRLYEQLLKYVQARTTMLVVDESNLIKNYKTIRTQRIIKLSEYCKYRIILNGTPVSKSLIDVFAQWYVLDWRILGYRSFWGFAKKHIEYDKKIRGKVSRIIDVDYITDRLIPYSFQASRKDCFTLPNKNYYDYEYSLTEKQQEHYEAVVSKLIEELDEERPSTIYRMFTAAQDIISGLFVKNKKTIVKEGLNSTIVEYHIKTSPMFENPLENPRIEKLLYIIESYIKNDKQVIIFAKYTHEIKMILSVLPKSIGFYGGLSHKERIANLEKFKNGEMQYLVANKTCAGYGLNLQFCNTVIFYSNDWDFATRAQAEDRVYRLGQEHEVEIYDIVASRTLDVKIMRCLEQKESLSDSIKASLKEGNSVINAKGEYNQWLHGEIKE